MRTCQFVGNIIIKVKWSRNWPGVAQRVDTGIALLFRDRGTRRGWRVSSAPRPHFIPGKEPVPILQEAGWAPGSVWTNRKSLPHWDSIPDRPAHSQSLYRLSFPAQFVRNIFHIYYLGNKNQDCFLSNKRHCVFVRKMRTMKLWV